MNKIKFLLLNRIIFLPLCLLLTTNALRSQDYVLLSENFEDKDDSSWYFKNAQITDRQSYKGQRSMQVGGKGEVARVLAIPDQTDEIVLRGWIKLVGVAAKSKKQQKVKENAQKAKASGDTTFLDDVVFVSSSTKAAYVTVEGYTSEGRIFIKGGQAGFLFRNNEWAGFETEISLPKGVTKIRVTCKNTIDSSTAYFDAVDVELRQLGFVKADSPWAKQLRQMKERASRLVKNGDFEDGAQIWNSYWGFELSNLAHTGQRSCMIQNADPKAWRGSGNDKLFKIPAGTKKLKVSVWIKADNIVGGANAWETGGILLSFADSHGNEVPGGEAVARTVGTHDWKKFETYFTVSERATNFKIALQMAASTGKIYFDDIMAEPLTDEQFYQTNIILKNPGFENLLSGWPSYAGEASTEEAHTGQYSLKVSGTNAAWEMRMQSITLIRGKKEFTFSIWMKTVGVTETPNSWEGARTLLEFKDVNGIILSDVAIGRAVGNTDWQLFTQKVTIPEDAVELSISCGRANVSGKAYFDDAKIEY